MNVSSGARVGAHLLGHHTLDRAVPLIEDRLELAGRTDRCTSVRGGGLAVLDLEAGPARAVEAVVAEAVRAVTDDRAEVICLGCGGMAGADRAVKARTGVPAVDGLAAASTRSGSSTGRRADQPRPSIPVPPINLDDHESADKYR